MPNSNQILSMIQSHLDQDDVRFREIALQIAASEANTGHIVLARSITDMLQSKKGPRVMRRAFNNSSLDMQEYMIEIADSYLLSDLICPEVQKGKIERIIHEYVQRDSLSEYGLANLSKILLTAKPGTGKTMTASVLANELHLPLYVIRLEKIITKFMGETSLKLSKVFDTINQVRGVYLFDEFDAIGAKRVMENEVGEMRRVLNTFLQLLEQCDSGSIVVAATNNPQLLDEALFRRFDDIIEYAYPKAEDIIALLKKTLHAFDLKYVDLNELSSVMYGLSHAEIVKVCTDAMKEVVLYQKTLDTPLLMNCIQSKQSITSVG